MQSCLITVCAAKTTGNYSSGRGIEEHALFLVADLCFVNGCPEEYPHYAERVEHYVPIFKEEFTFYPPRREQDVKLVMPAVAVSGA